MRVSTYNSRCLRFMAACMALSLPGLMLAIPAKRGLRTVRQPDGTEIRIKATGDEHSHRMFTQDNLPIVYVEKVGFVYATVDADGYPVASNMLAGNPENRSAAEKTFIASLDTKDVDGAYARLRARNLKARSSRRSANVPASSGFSEPQPGTGLCETTVPSTGKQKHIAILVEFKDKKFSINNPLDFYTRQLNEDGFDDYGATGSVKEWFVDNSKGQFDPDFEVYGPVTLSHNYRYYGQNDSWGYDARPEDMIIEACDLLKDQVDFSKYDNDKDGNIDSVYVIYAGNGEADNTENPNLVWPHSFDISQVKDEIFIYNNCRLDHYTCSNELDYQGDNNNAIVPAGIGTFVHEFSHALGLPDLYVTSDYSDAYTPGAFQVLDYGPYNNEGRTPPNYSSYERFALNWMQPDVITASGTYTLNPLQDDNKALLIATGNSNEFFLLENRQLKDNDAYLPGHGMLVWHVYYDKYTWDNNTVNNDAEAQGVDLIEADNDFDDETQNGDPFPGIGHVTSLGYDTTPALRTRDGKKVFVEISDIKEEDGVISMEIEFDPSAVENTFMPENANPAKGVFVADATIRTTYETTCEVYDLMGRRCATINASEGYRPAAAGIYVVTTPYGTIKMNVK